MVPKVVGLTGGIGSGKTSARRAFTSLGIPCIDFDEVARSLHQDASHPVMKELREHFPHAITSEGVLSQTAIRKLIMLDRSANENFKAILRPHILKRVSYWTAVHASPYVIWETALLMDQAIPVDFTVVIDASVPLRCQRVLNQHSDWTEQDFMRIVEAQKPTFEGARREWQLISNEGTQDELERAVLDLHGLLCERWKIQPKA